MNILTMPDNRLRLVIAIMALFITALAVLIYPAAASAVIFLSSYAVVVSPDIRRATTGQTRLTLRDFLGLSTAQFILANARHTANKVIKTPREGPRTNVQRKRDTRSAKRRHGRR